MDVLCVGLTGGIASGKSFVAMRFGQLGVPVLDADQVARDVVAPGQPALRAIVEQFGEQFLLPDGGLDRRRMRAYAFSKPKELRRLEAITHPAIRDRVRTWRARQTAPYCIYATAILVEANGVQRTDRVLVIDVPTDVQLKRVLARDHCDEALARRMIDAQAPRAARLAAADDILDNSAGDTSILPPIDRLHQLYTYLANTRQHA